MNFPKNFICEKCGGLVGSPKENWELINEFYLYKDDFVCSNCGIHYKILCDIRLEEKNPNKYTIETNE